jgi:glycosyltransferase involved in cell wall biosynthesis
LNYIDITPFTKEIELIYQKIDIVIVPSVFDDPFPTTVLEGMFFCKPIIGTKVGGIPEMIKDGITGFVVERDNAADLCDKIKYFINNPDKVKEMGINGNNYFLQNFSEECYMKNYSRMLSEIL